MIESKDTYGMEKSMEDLKRYFIPKIYSYYQGCLEEGFDKDQAFALAQDYHSFIMKQASAMALSQPEE